MITAICHFSERIDYSHPAYCFSGRYSSGPPNTTHDERGTDSSQALGLCSEPFIQGSCGHYSVGREGQEESRGGATRGRGICGGKSSLPLSGKVGGILR